MATIKELSEATTHVNVFGGDPHAWRAGLSMPDQSKITGLLGSPKEAWDAPGAVPDTLIGALRNQHPNLFSPTGSMVFPAQGPAGGAPPPASPADPVPAPPAPTPAPPPGQPAPQPGDSAPPAPAPAPPGADPQQGEAAETIKKLEAALKGQNSAVAEADRTLATAVLNAYSNTVDGKQKLGVLQQSIEDAVNRQTALDTPMGAREFQKFLLSKQKEIIDVVAQADLDDKSKREILAGLSAFNAVPNTDKPDNSGSNTNGNNTTGGESGGTGSGGGDTGGSGATPPGSDAGDTGDPLADLLSDPGLLSDPALLGGSDPLGGMGSQMPQIPMPAMPGLGGGGGLPGLFGGGAPASSGLSDLLKPKDDGDDPESIKSLLDDPLLNAPPGGEGSEQPPSLLEDPNNPEGENKPEGEGENKPNNEQPVSGAPVPGPLTPPVPAGTGPTEVHLPNGQTVTAPNPQMASVTKAIAEGTPIGEAFRQHAGVTIPPAGAAVPNPMDPSRLTMGAVGQYTDHQVYAINKDLVVINGQIHPVSDASGPGFLGWLPPPEIPTAPLAPPTTTSAPPPAAPPAPAPNGTTPAPATGTTLLTPTGQR